MLWALHWVGSNPVTLGPVVPPFGPTPSALCVLGEAPGEHESERLRPFVGPSGRELRRMLRTIGVELDNVFHTNVFNRQPPGNSLVAYCGVDTRVCPRGLSPLTLNPIGYVAAEHTEHLDRLYAELAACAPNVILALGNTACWALGLGQGINSLRGSVHLWTNPLTGTVHKVLPTYHPAAVLRQWDLRVVGIADMEKAHVESTSPDLRFDNTELWLSPTLEDIREFDTTYMVEARVCATDVETKRGQITCVSFAPDAGHSLVIPFWQEGPDPNYWGSVVEEQAAWGYVQRWLERGDLVKVMQNGLYDIQYFVAHGMRPRACTEDTMLLHHSLYSELQKGLGFLGSVYANVPSWKHMRTAKKEEVLKRDD